MTRLLCPAMGAALSVAGLGCQGTGGGAARTTGWTALTSASAKPILRVVTLFYQKPWLNLDAAGDRDPEGIEYRVFLDPGDGKGVHRDGNLLMAMYIIARTSSGEIERNMVSDWNYPTSEFTRIASPLLGEGYHLRLRWARKDIAGKEVEIITRFENPDGTIVSAGTKRLRVPKYAS